MAADCNEQLPLSDVLMHGRAVTRHIKGAFGCCGDGRDIVDVNGCELRRREVAIDV